MLFLVKNQLIFENFKIQTHFPPLASLHVCVHKTLMLEQEKPNSHLSFTLKDMVITYYN